MEFPPDGETSLARGSFLRSQFSTAMLPQAAHSWTIFEAAHLLNRAGFGGSPSDIKAFHALGREPAVDSLISPTEPLDAFPLPAWTTDAIALADMRKRLEQRKTLQQAMERRRAAQWERSGNPPLARGQGRGRS